MSNAAIIKDVTRRLLGRHLITIDRVTGLRGFAPAVVLIWSNGTDEGLRFPYDATDYFDQLAAARDHAGTYLKTHDVIDNTL